MTTTEKSIIQLVGEVRTLKNDLTEQIEVLKSRNTRVEKEKAWEISWQRKISIIVTTYFVMILILWSLGNDRPFLNAIVPTLGYTLSTLSMGWIKRIFLKGK